MWCLKISVFLQVWFEIISCIGGILVTIRRECNRELNITTEYRMNNGSTHLPQIHHLLGSTPNSSRARLTNTDTHQTNTCVSHSPRMNDNTKRFKLYCSEIALTYLKKLNGVLSYIKYQLCMRCFSLKGQYTQKCHFIVVWTSSFCHLTLMSFPNLYYSCRNKNIFNDEFKTTLGPIHFHCMNKKNTKIF